MKTHARFFSAAAVALLTATSAHARGYDLIDLGLSSDPISSTYASRVNDNGYVVGYFYLPNQSGGQSTLPELWINEVPTELPSVQNTTAIGVNSFGEAVGSQSNLPNEFGETAVYWDRRHHALFKLPNLGSDPSAENDTAVAINNHGQIAGIAGGSFPYASAVVWQRQNPSSPTFTVKELTAPYTACWPRDINDNGVVVGSCGNPGDGFGTQAVQWVDGVFSKIGGPGTDAFAINKSGTIVGCQYFNDGTVQPVVWVGGVLIGLPFLAGQFSQALGINDRGQIVGLAFLPSGEERAVLWKPETVGWVVTDLNAAVDASVGQAGWVLRSASGVSNAGRIVGNMDNVLTGEHHAFELRPRSAPSSAR